MDHVRRVREAAGAYTGWRVEGTLREFPKFKPVNLWFRYPVHQLDDSGILGDLDADGTEPKWKKAQQVRRQSAEQQRKNQEQQFAEAIANCCAGEPPTVGELVQYFAGTGKEMKPDTIRKNLKKFGFFIDKNNGKIRKESQVERDEM